MARNRTMDEYYREQGIKPPESISRAPAKYPKSLKKFLRPKSGARVRNQLMDYRAGTRVRKVNGGAVELGKKR